MRKPSKRKASRKPREFYILLWRGLTKSKMKRDAFYVLITASKTTASCYTDGKNGEPCKMVLVREVLPKRRGAR